MDIKKLNKEANNTSGVRADYKYGNMLDQMRYMYILKYTHDNVVLDFACGTGWGSYLIAQSGAKKVYSVDFSKDAIETAKKYYTNKHIDYYYGDLLENNIDESSIDTIACIETIAHLDNPEKYLEYFHKKIKNDGLLIITTPNAYVFNSIDKNEPLYPYHYKEYNKADIVSMLKDKWTLVDYKGQYPMAKDSKTSQKYRKWISDYYKSMEIIRRYKYFGFLFTRLLKKMGVMILDEPAFNSNCEPTKVELNMEPAFHMFVLKPVK